MKNNIWRFLVKSLCVCCVLAAAFALQFSVSENTDAQPVLFTTADAATYSGKCGSSISWSLNTSTDVLTIKGSGNMYTYEYTEDLPWYKYRNDIKTVNIANGVHNIGHYVFIDCTKLTTVKIPSSVTSIGEGAFYNCTALKSIKIPSSVTNIEAGAFYNCSSLASIEIKGKVTRIKEATFCGCSSLTSINIPNSVVSIGDAAFGYCSALTSIKIPKNVDYIGEAAFANCSKLKSINIPNGVSSIPAGTFGNCSSLKSIDIPNSVNYIGEAAFINCSSLTSVEIPDGVKNIEDMAFCYCSSLKSIIIPDKCSAIGYAAFADCTALKSVEIQDGVTKIDEAAFYNCSKLNVIEIPNSVKYIKETAFAYCDHLYEIRFIGTQKEWNALSIEDGNDYLINGTIHFYSIDNEKKPTCTAKGYKKYVCSDCSEKYTKSIAATGHKIRTYTTKAKINSDGSIIKKCKNCSYQESKTIIYQPTTFTLAETTYIYDGKIKRPAVTIKASDGTTLIEGTDYTLRYSSDRTNIGEYAVTVIFQGKYSGTEKLNFSIVAVKATSKITVSKTASSIEATWSTVSGAKGYKVFLYKGSECVASKVLSSSYSSYTFNNLSSGTAYTVKVKVYNKINGKIYWSEAKSLNTATSPKATSKLTVSQTTASIKASWSKVSGATGYKIYLYKGSTLVKSKIVSSKYTNYTFTELSAGTKYKVKVQVYKKINGTNYWSTIKSLVTATKPATTSITSLTAGTKSATVKWKNVSGESGYQVYYATSKDGTYKLGANLSANDIDTTVKSLTKGKTYYFKVRSYIKTDSGTVYSAFSSVKSVKVK